MALDDEQLICDARKRSHAMTLADFEDQVRDFAAGNAGLEDPRITRELVDRVAQRPQR